MLTTIMSQPDYRDSDGGSAVAIAGVKAEKKQFFSRYHLNQIYSYATNTVTEDYVEATKTSEPPAVRSSAKGISNTLHFIHKIHSQFGRAECTDRIKSQGSV